jgi:N-acetylmuramoyl-L-alanine amidase
MKLLKCLFT